MGGKTLQQQVAELLQDCYTLFEVRVVNIQSDSSHMLRVHYVIILEKGIQLRLRAIMDLIKKQLFGRGHPHSRRYEVREAFVDTNSWELRFPE